MEVFKRSASLFLIDVFRLGERLFSRPMSMICAQVLEVFPEQDVGASF